MPREVIYKYKTKGYTRTVTVYSFIEVLEELKSSKEEIVSVPRLSDFLSHENLKKLWEAIKENPNMKKLDFRNVTLEADAAEFVLFNIAKQHPKLSINLPMLSIWSPGQRAVMDLCDAAKDLPNVIGLGNSSQDNTDAAPSSKRRRVERPAVG